MADILTVMCSNEELKRVYCRSFSQYYILKEEYTGEFCKYESNKKWELGKRCKYLNVGKLVDFVPRSPLEIRLTVFLMSKNLGVYISHLLRR